MPEMILKKSRFIDWLVAMRLPFTTVALVPFAMGGYLAYQLGKPVSWTRLTLGLLAVLCICVGCYLLGEVFDQKEDNATSRYGRSAFAGGTLLVVNGTLSEQAVSLVAVTMFVVAGALGVMISIWLNNYWLLTLGAFGVFSAAAYSLPPLRLVKRGIGELFITVCYGWLTLVTGHAVASGHMLAYSYLLCLPMAFSIFNVIFINEFPDYEADREGGKHNLLQRVEKPLGAVIYAAMCLFVVIAFTAIWLVFRRGSLLHLGLILPVCMLSLWLAVQVLFLKKWQERSALEPICALTIILNHLCSITVGALFTW